MTLVAGPASLLCMHGDGDRFRLELERNKDAVKLFDTIKSYGYMIENYSSIKHISFVSLKRLNNVKLMCLSSWQRELIEEKFKQFISGCGVPDPVKKLEGESRYLMETVNSVIEDFASKNPNMKALMKSQMDESFSLLEET